MNRLILTILALGISIGCYARTSPNTKSKYPRAEIKVSYHCHDQHLKTDAKAYVAEYQMILLANPTYSKFYNMQCEYIDSLHSTPSGKAKYRKMLDIAARKAVETGNFDAVPAAPSKIYVFKSSSDSTCTVFDTNGSSGNHFYAEAPVEMRWQINDSTKNCTFSFSSVFRNT